MNMKNIGAIKHKLQQIRFRYLKKVLDAGLRQHPDNCLFYIEQNGIGLCSSIDVTQSGTRPVICNPDVCAGCSNFSNIHSKESLKQGFKETLEEMSFPELAYHYPDMAALQWVLEDEAPPVLLEEDRESRFITPEPEPVMYRSWIRRLFNV
jgi:hypothetical protein